MDHLGPSRVSERNMPLHGFAPSDSGHFTSDAFPYGTTFGARRADFPPSVSNHSSPGGIFHHPIRKIVYGFVDGSGPLGGRTFFGGPRGSRRLHTSGSGTDQIVVESRYRSYLWNRLLGRKVQAHGDRYLAPLK